MQKRSIFYLKLMRLMLSILMAISIPVYYYFRQYYTLPDHEYTLTFLFGIFVFLLGLQYKLEKKTLTVAYFMMLFSIMMCIMSMLGMTR